MDPLEFSEPDREFLSRYEVEALLGRGAMGMRPPRTIDLEWRPDKLDWKVDSYCDWFVVRHPAEPPLAQFPLDLVKREGQWSLHRKRQACETPYPTCAWWDYPGRVAPSSIDAGQPEGSLIP